MHSAARRAPLGAGASPSVAAALAAPPAETPAIFESRIRKDAAFAKSVLSGKWNEFVSFFPRNQAIELLRTIIIPANQEEFLNRSQPGSVIAKWLGSDGTELRLRTIWSIDDRRLRARACLSVALIQFYGTEHFRLALQIVCGSLVTLRPADSETSMLMRQMRSELNGSTPSKHQLLLEAIADILVTIEREEPGCGHMARTTLRVLLEDAREKEVPPIDSDREPRRGLSAHYTSLAQWQWYLDLRIRAYGT